jgi:hypothetical protein
MGAAARELAQAELDPAVSMARVDAIYRSVIDGA